MGECRDVNRDDGVVVSKANISKNPRLPKNGELNPEKNH